jgi:hypothetical protein
MEIWSIQKTHLLEQVGLFLVRSFDSARGFKLDLSRENKGACYTIKHNYTTHNLGYAVSPSPQRHAHAQRQIENQIEYALERGGS